MTDQVKWLVEKHVVVVTLEPQISWEDYAQLDQRLAALLESGVSPVDVILDATAVQSFPTDMKALEARTSYLRHPHLRWVMLAGRNKLLRLVMTVVCSKLDQRVYFHNTLDEAVNSLATAVDNS